VNPVIREWLLKCSRDNPGPHTTLGLDRMAGYLFSEAQKRGLGVPVKRHLADEDAQITQMIYRTLSKHMRR
jgi:hypothetical protein